MTNLNGIAPTVPFTQMTFVFPETEMQQAIPLGVSAPHQEVERKGKVKSFESSVTRSPANAQRRNKPEHISDLLLVVLDRYGIDANEFMAGLE